MQHNAAFSLTRLYGPAVAVKGSLRRASPALDRAHRTLLSSPNPLEFQKRHFFAQQMRSLNLVWALFRTGNIKEYDQIAVIGGGLAGITAAVALLNKRVDVKLFEQYHELFHLLVILAAALQYAVVAFWIL